jgi:ferrous iron transport protein A
LKDNENNSHQSTVMPNSSVSSLVSLLPGQDASIASIHAGEALHHRLAAMGFRIGRRIQLMRRGALDGPLHVRIGSTDIIIRRSDAACVKVSA